MVDDLADVFAETLVVETGAHVELIPIGIFHFVRVLEIDGRDIMLLEMRDI